MSLQDRQTVIVSGGGQEYTRPLTVEETRKRDISAYPISMGLSASHTTPPVSWTTAVETASGKTYVRIVQFLVASGTTLGDYYLWIKITSTPEIIIRPVATVFVR